MRCSARWPIAAVLIAAVLLPGPVPLSAGQTADPQYLEAQRLFDGLEYESAIRALDLAIASLQAREPGDPARRDLLPSAYEMRARSKFGLGDQEGARADFVLLLGANPAYALTGQVSPRVVTLFEETVRNTVTNLLLSVAPVEAAIAVDGVPIPQGQAVPVVVGTHTLTVNLLGYRPIERTITAEAGFTTELNVVMERTISILSVLTSPPDVAVAVDGVARGRTGPGPAPGRFADAVGRAGLSMGTVSAPLTVVDLAAGSHLIELTRDCFVRAEARVSVDQPDDYTVGPIALTPAVSRLVLRSSAPDSQVYIDGQARGVAPLTLTDICEGDHTVELRTPAGRYFRRVRTRTGEELTIEGTIKPAFALVSLTGQAESLSADLRAVVEQAFEPSRALTLFAPAAEDADRAIRANQLPAAWLAFDDLRRPVGAAADLLPNTRRDAAVKLADEFSAQGVASLTVLERNHVTLALLASGATEPDVLDVRIDQPASIAAAIAALDRTPTFFRPTIGLVAIDVADTPGAIVVGIDPNGPAAAAGVAVGETIVAAGGTAVSDAASLASILSSQGAGAQLPLTLQARTGTEKQATVTVSMAPRLIGISDQTLLVNRLLAGLRADLRSEADPSAQAIMRLNLAVALTRVGAWAEARTELQRVTLPEGPGVAGGTVQYLLGLTAEQLGNLTDAQAAYAAAAQSESGLTDDGPAVRELAEAKLADLQRRAGGGR